MSARTSYPVRRDIPFCSDLATVRTMETVKRSNDSRSMLDSAKSLRKILIPSIRLIFQVHLSLLVKFTANTASIAQNSHHNGSLRAQNQA